MEKGVSIVGIASRTGCLLAEKIVAAGPGFAVPGHARRIRMQ
jgi:hypothetical protein